MLEINDNIIFCIVLYHIVVMPYTSSLIENSCVLRSRNSIPCNIRAVVTVIHTDAMNCARITS